MATTPLSGEHRIPPTGRLTVTYPRSIALHRSLPGVVRVRYGATPSRKVTLPSVDFRLHDRRRVRPGDQIESASWVRACGRRRQRSIRLCLPTPVRRVCQRRGRFSMGRATRRTREVLPARAHDHPAHVEQGSPGTDGGIQESEGALAHERRDWGGLRSGAGHPCLHATVGERQAVYRARRC